MNYTTITDCWAAFVDLFGEYNPADGGIDPEWLRDWLQKRGHRYSDVTIDILADAHDDAIGQIITDENG